MTKYKTNLVLANPRVLSWPAAAEELNFLLSSFFVQLMKRTMSQLLERKKIEGVALSCFASARSNFKFETRVQQRGTVLANQIWLLSINVALSDPYT
jgi:hypothetical protein